jgi:alginate O-acetyltransferase complex protein AlgI
MLFQTQEFLVLLLAVIAGIALLRSARDQQWMLSVASYVFYGWWDVRFLMLIVASTVIDYAASLGMAGVKLEHRERLRLSGLVLVGVALFLIPNWPAIQGGGPPTDDPAPLLGPAWTGGWYAVGVVVAFALVGPALYGGYFRLSENARRRAFLTTSVVANLGMLGFFKYFNFFTDSAVGLGAMLGFDIPRAALDVALPVGISFYTFQTMSYTIDAYRGHVKPERSLLRVALYVAYFPQLVAGPILRPQQFFPALARAWRLEPANLSSGFHLIAVGLFKKVLIADQVAPMVNTIFGDPQGQSSLLVMFATGLFAVQIYCDFSGYTDIARGVSRLFGIEIPLNFNFPYLSTSIIDFWRRWHISLSTWLRDYLYIPLGGSRVSVGHMYFNLMATMTLGGLWHGASWNFVIWGVYQGALLCINRVLRGMIDARPRLKAAADSVPGTVLRWAVTGYFWMLGWLIFRVTDFADLWYCLKKFVLFDGQLGLSGLGLGQTQPFVAAGAALVFCVLHAWGFFGRRWVDRLDDTPRRLRPALYALLGLVFYFGWPTAEAPFIYFQF